MFVKRVVLRSPDGEGSGGDGDGNPPNPNTPKELARARADAKAHREERDTARRELDEKRAEADGLRSKLKETETSAAKTLEEKLEALRAEMTGQVTEANTKAEKAETTAKVKLIKADLRIAAKDAGMVDMDLLQLVDVSKVELDDEGNVKNADTLIADLKKNKPYAFGGGSSANPSKPPAPGDTQPKKAADMTPKERAAAAQRLGFKL